MKLFCINASKPLGTGIATRLGVELASHEERSFEDSEFKIRPLESVRQEQVFVVQSLHGEDAQSANDKLCRLLFFIGALVDAGAAEVVALVPYMAYARKDRRSKPRDPVTTRYVAGLFEAVGVHEVVTIDIHNLAAFENAFRCRKQNLPAANLLAGHFRATLDMSGRIVVMAPDAGAVKRARSFANLLAEGTDCAVDLAFMEKQRSEGRVSGTAFAGDVRDATVIVVDDMISGGTTMARAARACMERGARAVHATATHGVFASEADDRLATVDIESIVVTDTVVDVEARCPSLAATKLAVLECAPLLVGAIERLTGRERPGARGR